MCLDFINTIDTVNKVMLCPALPIYLSSITRTRSFNIVSEIVYTRFSIFTLIPTASIQIKMQVFLFSNSCMKNFHLENSKLDENV